MPQIYQEESRYIVGCADCRTDGDISVQTAMRNALFDFRKSVKKSLADVV